MSFFKFSLAIFCLLMALFSCSNALTCHQTDSGDKCETTNGYCVVRKLNSSFNSFYLNSLYKFCCYQTLTFSFSQKSGAETSGVAVWRKYCSESCTESSASGGLGSGGTFCCKDKDYCNSATTLSLSTVNLMTLFVVRHGS